jgi:hypothetical protein
MCAPIDETAARESATMESFTSGLFGFAKTETASPPAAIRVRVQLVLLLAHLACS